MTAKVKLLMEIARWSERDAEVALRAVEEEHAPETTATNNGEPEMAPLPAGWGETLTGEPMPNVVAAVHRSREDH